MDLYPYIRLRSAQPHTASPSFAGQTQFAEPSSPVQGIRRSITMNLFNPAFPSSTSTMRSMLGTVAICRMPLVHLPSLHRLGFCGKRPFPADHLVSSCVKEGGSVVSEVPPGRDGNSFLSDVLNIKWRQQPATPPESVRLAPAEIPETLVPVSLVP